MNAKIIAITNQKGGVDKTATCANLGIRLAQEGKKTNPQWSGMFVDGLAPKKMEDMSLGLRIDLANDKRLRAVT